MKNIFLFLLLILLLGSCTERMTKQFIVTKENSHLDTKKVENWYIEPPNLIAFKNKDINKIDNNPPVYWLTIRAISIKNILPNNTLKIDSVGLKFIEIDSTIWRTPSRIAPYNESKNNVRLAFDFFNEEGVFIPDTVSNIKLFFDAVLLDTISNSQKTHKISFDMIRKDTVKLAPFMIR